MDENRIGDDGAVALAELLLGNTSVRQVGVEVEVSWLGGWVGGWVVSWLVAWLLGCLVAWLLGIRLDLPACSHRASWTSRTTL